MTDMARPNDVSTTLAPCSCAMRAQVNAIDDGVSTPVTSTTRSSSSTRSPSGLRAVGTRRRPGHRGPFAWPWSRWGWRLWRRRANARRRRRGCPPVRSPGRRSPARAAMRGVHISARYAVLEGQPHRLGVLGLGDLPAVQDGDRPRRAHHGDLGGRPGEHDVAAHRLGVHHDVRAAVGLPKDHAHPRHRRPGVGVDELGAVADHPPPLEVLAGLVARRVDEGQQREPEGVGVLDVAGRLAGGLDVDGAGPDRRLVRHDRDHMAADPPVRRTPRSWRAARGPPGRSRGRAGRRGRSGRRRPRRAAPGRLRRRGHRLGRRDRRSARAVVR